MPYESGAAAITGYKVLKVWSYGRREVLTTRECMKNAIHGVLFKGVQASSDTGNQKDLKALVPDGPSANQDYFDNFFESGDFLQFVQATNNGQLAAGDVMKISKKEYKIGLVVQINYKALRDKLQKDGIIKSLDFLF